MDIIEHFNRAHLYNNKWFTNYKWIMPFVNSEKQGCELAIAEFDNVMVVINKEGTPIQIIDPC